MTKPFAKWILIRGFVLAVVVSSLLAQGQRAGDSNDSAKTQGVGPRINEGILRSEDQLGATDNSSQLKVSYKRRKEFRDFAANRTTLVSQQAVNRIVEALKSRIALPFDLRVVFAECGGPDSYYDENSHEIFICYELIDTYYDLFSGTLKTRTARDEAAKGAVVSMFLHEVAHALIDAWDLPITGREEDAADQFSTLLLINGFPDGDEMALNGARSFKFLANLETGLEKDYSDPHSPDEQRFFDTICLLYGHSPEQYEYLIENGTLPRGRAFDCEEDYARISKSWQTLLAPHVFSRTAPSLPSDSLGFLGTARYPSRMP